MAQEYNDSQVGDESGVTGPGAPTPVSALEVSLIYIKTLEVTWPLTSLYKGSRRSYKARYPVGN